MMRRHACIQQISALRFWSFGRTTIAKYTTRFQAIRQNDGRKIFPIDKIDSIVVKEETETNAEAAQHQELVKQLL
jgi:hypothetical protein